MLRHSSESARLDSELLLAHALQQTRSWLHAWPEKTLSDEQQQLFRDLLARRSQGEPMAHIIGEQEFWSLKLKVTPDTLIPRADTERLVELALERIPDNAFWNIADLGTGSGAIALAIASERPGVEIVATDKSLKALTIAEENARLNKLEHVRFVRSIWFDELHDQVFDMIVSNPPYIAEEDPHLSHGDVRFDPGSALTAGPSGLDDLSHLIEHAPSYLKVGGWLLLEHGYDQGEAVIHLMQQAGFQHCQDFTDYGNNPRVAIGQWS